METEVLAGALPKPSTCVSNGESKVNPPRAPVRVPATEVTVRAGVREAPKPSGTTHRMLVGLLQLVVGHIVLEICPEGVVSILTNCTPNSVSSARPVVAAFVGFRCVRLGASNENASAAVPMSPDIERVGVSPVPLPVLYSAQRTRVTVTHPEVTHDVAPIRTEPLASLVTKFIPSNVTKDDPVVGPFRVVAVRTGASKVNNAEDAVPGSVAISIPRPCDMMDAGRGTIS